MDADASPLVKADTLASQGEALTARKAFQQALTAHNEAARNYQLAAQATLDTGAAKVLLLQRDQQLRLAANVSRKLQERGNTTSHGEKRAAAAQNTQSKEAPAKRLPLQYIPSSSRNPQVSGQANALYSPRDRLVEASMMADSRYSRRSSSPSASVISSIHPPSGESGRTIGSAEESFYLMGNEADPSDPMSAFLNMVDNMVEELGNAVAFASLPLHNPPVGTPDGTAQVSGGSTAVDSEAVQPTHTGNHVQESFYVVPPGSRAAQGHVRKAGSSEDTKLSSTKTHEELVHENATLKETLDNLSKRLDHFTKERQRDRDALRGSVTLFARDVRKQAERVMMVQSTANLAEARRNLPSASMYPGALQQQLDRQNDAENPHKRIAELEEQLRVARAEAEKQTALASRYKTRYEDLRKAILEKRKAKEEAQAAAQSEQPAQT